MAMTIIQENEQFLVVENDETLYIAKSEDEAQGFINWKLRPNAGNASEDCNC